MMNAMPNISARSAAIALLALASFGCASVPVTYRPTQVGMLPGEGPTSGLVLILRPDRTAARIGDQISFDIILKNLGNSAVWIPSSPEILLTWVYPDGKCDNFVSDSDSNAASPVLAPLAPGEERRFRSLLTTYYFSRKGVTEFRARLSIPRQTQGDERLAWAGDVASNGYGVLFAN